MIYIALKSSPLSLVFWFTDNNYFSNFSFLSIIERNHDGRSSCVKLKAEFVNKYLVSFIWL